MSRAAAGNAGAVTNPGRAGGSRAHPSLQITKASASGLDPEAVHDEQMNATRWEAVISQSENRGT